MRFSKEDFEKYGMTELKELKKELGFYDRTKDYSSMADYYSGTLVENKLDLDEFYYFYQPMYSFNFSGFKGYHKKEREHPVQFSSTVLKNLSA
mmetsp:Transcript_33131/g.30053  ORF Transcript_33131/g.30053 Transcript_33131/m.30053 type:complete len:93 (-) Transcript_33131:1223-1501(-)